jgi:hypothetical protein
MWRLRFRAGIVAVLRRATLLLLFDLPLSVTAVLIAVADAWKKSSLQLTNISILSVR